MTSPAPKGALSALRGFARRPQAERCELCSLPIDRETHSHLIDPVRRVLLCACDGCATLFDTGGATRYRRVPRDIRRLDGLALSPGESDDAWEKMLIPIGLAFFYRSSRAGKVVALYPSPAGVTESQLDLEPRGVIATLREDVEALLVNRVRERREHFVAPIDRCFELVGIVRRHWSGFSGGDKVWEEIDRFFARLKEKASP